MRCQQPGGQYIACELTLQEAAGLEILLESTACIAHNNILRMTKPTQQVLTNDGCYMPNGTLWEIGGVFPAGTTVAMQIEGPRLQNPAELRVQGGWPEWTLFYEDGADQDFDDMILIVKALLPTD